MNYFNNTLTEELILLEINQLSSNPNVIWLLLEADNYLKQLGKWNGQVRNGNIDPEQAADQLASIIKGHDFGSWDVMNVKEQWLDLLKAKKAGKIDNASFEKRTKQIKKEALLYNTLFSLGKLLWNKVSGGSKKELANAFDQEDMNQNEYQANKQFTNWQPTSRNKQRAQNIAARLVELVGYRQALRLLQNAA